MGKKNNFKERSASSYERKSKGIELKTGKPARTICINYNNLDRNQGQSFADWERENLLALASDKLRSLTEHTVIQSFTAGLVKQYTKVTFPPNSGFTYPNHIPSGVTWCSIHVKGKQCIIGYFEDFIFNVVFLDKNHEFWPTEKKHT